MQMLKRSGESNFRLVELDILNNEYNLLYMFLNEPNNDMNAAAYNPVDGIAYAQFQYSDQAQRVLCRFSHLANSQQCFCTTGTAQLNSATFTSDGHYYLSSSGDTLQKLSNAASVVASDPLGPCTMTTILSSKSITGVDTTAWGVTLTDATALWGFNPASRPQWTYDATQDLMVFWNPSAQSFVDMVEFDHASVKYLVGAGTFDGSLMIVRLDAAGDADGFAFSRVRIRWNGHNDPGALNGLGAAYRYGNHIYFSANSGRGIFKVDGDVLGRTLDLADANACDWWTTHICGAAGGAINEVTDLDAITLIWVNCCCTQPTPAIACWSHVLSLVLSGRWCAWATAQEERASTMVSIVLALPTRFSRHNRHHRHPQRRPCHHQHHRHSRALIQSRPASHLGGSYRARGIQAAITAVTPCTASHNQIHQAGTRRRADAGWAACHSNPHCAPERRKSRAACR